MNRITNMALLGALAIGMIGWGAWALSNTAENASGSGAKGLAENNSPYESVEVLEIVPFELGQSMTHYWRQERPTFDRGALLMLKADREWLRKRQVSHPVLQYGNETLQVLNDGGQSGYAVVILPFTKGQDVSSLAGEPVFFGEVELPERITKGLAETAAAKAKAQGASTLSAAQLTAVQKPIVRAADEVALYRAAGLLLKRHSPGETQTISWLKGER